MQRAIGLCLKPVGQPLHRECMKSMALKKFDEYTNGNEAQLPNTNPVTLVAVLEDT